MIEVEQFKFVIIILLNLFLVGLWYLKKLVSLCMMLIYKIYLQHPIQNTRIPPPGLHPMNMNIPPPGMRHLPPPLNHHHPPPGVLPPGYLRMMPPHPQFIQANGPIRPPGFMYPTTNNQNQYPVSFSYRYYFIYQKNIEFTLIY